LRAAHAAEFELAPLSVFVEPARLVDLLGPSSQFEDSVRYLFEKQLAEAELIILSKTDLLDSTKVDGLRSQIKQISGDVPMILMSAKAGTGVNEWVERLLRDRSPGNHELDLDYQIYGQAEASLGWLNATVDVASGNYFSPTEFGETIVAKIREQCAAAQNAVAHVKVMLVTPQGSDRIALTTNSALAVWDGEGDLGLVREASVIVNARVAVSPGQLRRMVEEAVYSAARERTITATVLDLEAFAPTPPKRPIWQDANKLSKMNR
jgi:hypothetical protein